MGNRAVITTNENLEETGVYLHWNGGRDSVEGFLAYCKLKGYRSPDHDNYGWAMLACVIANFFGNGMSCGVDNCKELDCDNRDNGVYIIKDWLIAGRKFFHAEEQYGYDLRDFVRTLDERQPEDMRLTAEEWSRFGEVEKAVLAAREKQCYM